MLCWIVYPNGIMCFHCDLCICWNVVFMRLRVNVVTYDFAEIYAHSCMLYSHMLYWDISCWLAYMWNSMLVNYHSYMVSVMGHGVRTVANEPTLIIQEILSLWIVMKGSSWFSMKGSSCCWREGQHILVGIALRPSLKWFKFQNHLHVAFTTDHTHVESPFIW